MDRRAYEEDLVSHYLEHDRSVFKNKITDKAINDLYTWLNNIQQKDKRLGPWFTRRGPVLLGQIARNALAQKHLKTKRAGATMALKLVRDVIAEKTAQLAKPSSKPTDPSSDQPRLDEDLLVGIVDNHPQNRIDDAYYIRNANPADITMWMAQRLAYWDKNASHRINEAGDTLQAYNLPSLTTAAATFSKPANQRPAGCSGLSSIKDDLKTDPHGYPWGQPAKLLRDYVKTNKHLERRFFGKEARTILTNLERCFFEGIIDLDMTKTLLWQELTAKIRRDIEDWSTQH